MTPSVPQQSGSPYTFSATYNAGHDRFATIFRGQRPLNERRHRQCDLGRYPHLYLDAERKFRHHGRVGYLSTPSTVWWSRNRAGSYTQIVFPGPDGSKRALMTGPTLQKQSCLYSASPARYTTRRPRPHLHSDWLGRTPLDLSPGGASISSAPLIALTGRLTPPWVHRRFLHLMNAELRQRTIRPLPTREYSIQDVALLPPDRFRAHQRPTPLTPIREPLMAYVLNNPLSQSKSARLDCVYLWGDEAYIVAATAGMTQTLATTVDGINSRRHINTLDEGAACAALGLTWTTDQNLMGYLYNALRRSRFFCRPRRAVA